MLLSLVPNGILYGVSNKEQRQTPFNEALVVESNDDNSVIVVDPIEETHPTPRSVEVSLKSYRQPLLTATLEARVNCPGIWW